MSQNEEVKIEKSKGDAAVKKDENESSSYDEEYDSESEESEMSFKSKKSVKPAQPESNIFKKDIIIEDSSGSSDGPNSQNVISEQESEKSVRS